MAFYQNTVYIPGDIAISLISSSPTCKTSAPPRPRVLDAAMAVVNACDLLMTTDDKYLWCDHRL